MNLLNKIKPFQEYSGSSIRILLCIILIGLVLSSCLDEITLKVPTAIENKVTIYSKLIRSDPSIVTAFVARIGNVDDNQSSLPVPIEGVQVRLVDDEGNFVELEPAEPSGNYYLEIPNNYPDFQIEIGKNYKISVVTPEEKRYESAFEEIIPVPQPDSINAVYVEREELNSSNNMVITEYMQFLINTPLDRPDGKGKVHLKWEFFGDYEFRTLPTPVFEETMVCYISQRLGQGTSQVFNGVEAAGVKLYNQMILETAINSRFSFGFLITVYQQSITENAYNYWEKVKETTSLSGGMFEASPGKIKGNITNIDNLNEEVLGFFFVSDQTIIRRLVKPSEANYPVGTCHGQRWRRSDEICRDCLTRENSTLEIPKGWFE